MMIRIELNDHTADYIRTELLDNLAAQRSELKKCKENEKWNIVSHENAYRVRITEQRISQLETAIEEFSY